MKFIRRCGALSVGDQLLSVDETIVENSAYSPEEVSSLLDANCTKGYTQLQILPAHTLVRRRGTYRLSVHYLLLTHFKYFVHGGTL